MTMNITVKGFHIDYYGHVNHARYLEFMESARWEFFNTNIHNYMLPIININVDYISQAKLGNVLTITTEIKKITARTIIMEQIIYKHDNRDIVAYGEITMVVYDKNINKTIEITEEIRQMLST